MGGCLPFAVQIPILFSLYYVISQPLKYMLGKSSETISKLFDLIPAGADKIFNMKDISIISYFSAHMERLKDAGSMLQPGDLLNMDFLGVNLGTVPTLNIHQYIGSSIQTNHVVLLVVPLLAALTTYLSSKTAMMHAANQPQASGVAASQQKWMMLISPLMTGYFAFTVPAGLGLYWIVGNIFLILQQLIINKFVLNGKPEAAADKKSIQGTDPVYSIAAETKTDQKVVGKDTVKVQEADKPEPAGPT